MRKIFTIVLVCLCLLATKLPVEAKVIRGFDTDKTVTKVTVKSNKSGTLTVNWKKVPEGRYQVQVSTNKKFKKRLTGQTFENIYKVKKLKKGKTYYVRVRAFLPDSKGAIFTKWSKIKKVKVKK